MKFNMPLVGLLSALFTFCGCSSFNRDWRKAAANPVGIQGRWDGTWLSSHNGHTGQLRCIMEKISDGKYRARFDSTYKKVLHFKSTVILEGTETDGGFDFRGDAKLPWWAGGLYHYEGKVTPAHFFSTYECEYDKGTFQMDRPKE